MNKTAFERALRESLPNISSLTSLGFVYTTEMLHEATLRAVRQYSLYRPYKRRIDQGNMPLDAAIGQTELLVVGGLWKSGDQFQIRSFLSTTETLTVSDVDIADGLMDETVPTYKLTLESALTGKHRAGSLCVHVPPSDRPVDGLHLQGAVDTYHMPIDFITVEKESFDLAVGAKTEMHRSNSFYDAAYVISDALSGTGFGYRQGFGPMSVSGYPIVGDPFNNPNMGAFGRSRMVFEFYTAYPPYLTVNPAPTADKVLTFNYFGMHTIVSVPDVDMEALICYARFAAINALLAGIAAAAEEVREGDEMRSRAPFIKFLGDLMTHSRDDFDIKIRKRPYATSG